MSDPRKLKILPEAKAVALHSRRIAHRLRGTENAWFRSQIVRAAFSIPTNIIEGNGLQSAKEYARYVRTAINSSNELDFHLETVCELGLVAVTATAELQKKIEEVRKMLSGLLRCLERLAAEQEAKKRRKPRS